MCLGRPIRTRHVILALALSIASPLLAEETWIVRTDLWGNPAFSTLTVERRNDQIAGNLDGDRLSGQVTRNAIAFDAVDSDGRVSHYSATIGDDRMQGTVDGPDTNDATKRMFKAAQTTAPPTNRLRAAALTNCGEANRSRTATRRQPTANCHRLDWGT